VILGRAELLGYARAHSAVLAAVSGHLKKETCGLSSGGLGRQRSLKAQVVEAAVGNRVFLEVSGIKYLFRRQLLLSPKTGALG
jgi:hypothetical protein